MSRDATVMVDGKNDKKNRRLSQDGRRAAHVKWDGKTIALGTFPDELAERMCQRAKVLTKSWRQMYPKPPVEKVKHSLQKLGIRVVNDRPGRQAKNHLTPQPLHSSPPPPPGEDIRHDEDMLPIHALEERPDLRLSPPTLPAVAQNTAASSSTPPSLSHPSTPRHPLPASPTIPHLPAGDPAATPVNLPPNPSRPPVSSSQLSIKLDVDDPDIDRTYATLERHYQNLTEEMEEIQELMEFYRDKREQRDLARRMEWRILKREREKRDRKRSRRDGDVKEEEGCGREEDLLLRGQSLPIRRRIEDDITTPNSSNTGNANITDRPSCVSMDDVFDPIPIQRDDGDPSSSDNTSVGVDPIPMRAAAAHHHRSHPIVGVEGDDIGLIQREMSSPPRQRPVQASVPAQALPQASHLPRQQEEQQREQHSTPSIPLPLPSLSTRGDVFDESDGIGSDDSGF